MWAINFKKIIIGIIILFIVITGTLGGIYFLLQGNNIENYKEINNRGSIENVSSKDSLESENKNELNPLENEKKYQNNTSTEINKKEEKPVQEPPSESKSLKPNKNTAQVDKPMENMLPVEEPKENPIDKNNPIPTEKNVCEENNEEWLKYKSDFQKKYSKFMIFKSQKEAIDYGDYAAKKYGYGYYYANVPLKFEGSNCNREFWTANLYTGEFNCGETDEIIVPNFDLPATEKEKLVSIYDYAILKGFNCNDRSWVPIP